MYNSHFTRAIEKYGWDNFQHIIVTRGLTEDEAKWLEVELIKVWDTTNQDKGYNQTFGGDGVKGRITSEETRKKLSESHKGIFAGENNPMYGKNGKLNPMYGKTHTKETRQKMSENHADISGENNPNARVIICVTTNEIFLTINEGSEKYNIHRSSISQCCSGKYKSAGKHPVTKEKLVWMYYDEYLKI